MALSSSSEINQQLKNLNGWNYSNNQIFKEYQLNNFKEALAFVNKVGVEAEAMDHHPDILMHEWNKIKISISTHSEGGVTEKDFQLAKKIETLL